MRGKTFTTPALLLRLWIAKNELLAQTLFDDVDLGSVDNWQADVIDKNPHPVLLEYRIGVMAGIRDVCKVLPAGTTGLRHAKTQPDRIWSLVKKFAGARHRGRRQTNRHLSIIRPRAICRWSESGQWCVGFSKLFTLHNLF